MAASERIRFGGRMLSPLTEAQQELIATHLGLCPWGDKKFAARRSHLRRHNTPPEILETAAEDALILAAHDYKPERGSFTTWFVFKYSQYLHYLHYTYKAEARTPTINCYRDRRRILEDDWEKRVRDAERRALEVRRLLPQPLWHVFDASSSVVARTLGITTHAVRIRRQQARRMLKKLGVI